MGNFFKSIAVLLSVPLLLSGCNSSATSAENQQSSIQEEENLSDNANENTSTEASKEQITLTFSYWGDKNELACKEELIKDFEAAHPNIKIEATYTDGVSYHTKLQTFFTSGAAPDVISIAGDIMYDFAEEGVFEDLTPYIERDQVAGQWADGSLDIFTKHGKIYAAPYVSKVFAMAYNKDIFDAAGFAHLQKLNNKNNEIAIILFIQGSICFSLCDIKFINKHNKPEATVIEFPNSSQIISKTLFVSSQISIGL